MDQRLQKADEMRVATSFLSATLERISPRKNAAVTQVGSSLYLFAGAPNAVMWVGVMPARYGAGGRYFFRLALESQGPNRRPGDPVRTLECKRRLPGLGQWPSPGFWWPMRPALAWNTPTRMARVSPGCRNGPKRSGFPSRIRISLRTPAGDWPFLTIAMRQLPAGDNGRGGFSVGPE